MNRIGADRPVPPHHSVPPLAPAAPLASASVAPNARSASDSPPGSASHRTYASSHPSGHSPLPCSRAHLCTSRDAVGTRDQKADPMLCASPPAPGVCPLPHAVPVAPFKGPPAPLAQRHGVYARRRHSLRRHHPAAACPALPGWRVPHPRRRLPARVRPEHVHPLVVRLITQVGRFAIWRGLCTASAPSSSASVHPLRPRRLIVPGHGC